jgi:hypothetical protein
MVLLVVFRCFAERKAYYSSQFTLFSSRAADAKRSFIYEEQNHLLFLCNFLSISYLRFARAYAPTKQVRQEETSRP